MTNTQKQPIKGLHLKVIEILGEIPKTMKIPTNGYPTNNPNELQLAARMERLVDNVKILGYEQEEVYGAIEGLVKEGHLIIYSIPAIPTPVTLVAANPNTIKKLKINYSM